MRDIRIFLDVPLNSLAREDTLLGTKIISVTIIDPILALLGKNGTCLRDWVFFFLKLQH